MNGEEVQGGVRLGHLVGKVPGRHGRSRFGGRFSVGYTA